MQETWVWFLGWEDPLEKGMATYSSFLARRIPWTEEPGGLQSLGSQSVGQDWVTHFLPTRLLGTASGVMYHLKTLTVQLSLSASYDCIAFSSRSTFHWPALWDSKIQRSHLNVRRLIDTCFLGFQRIACVHAKPPLSCLTLWDPVDHSPPVSSVHGIL